MDHDGCAEVTIVESSRKISPLNNLRASTTRTLSKLRENHGRPKVDSHNKTSNSGHLPGTRKLWSRVSSFADRGSSIQQSNYPLDIELLLRLYACNSNMEKSIQRVIERAEERNFASAAESCSKTLSTNFPSIELGAAYRLIHFLKESCCKNPTSSSPSYCEILLALRKLVADCNDKRLKSFLLNDPSLTMCERCGVISCAGPLDFVHQQCHSHEKPHFLKGAGCSRFINTDDLIRAYRKIKSSRSEREQGEKLFNTQRLSTEKEKEIRSLAYDRTQHNDSSTIKRESLVPEKEDSTKSHKIIEVHISKETTNNNSNDQSNQINNPTNNTCSTVVNETDLQSKYNITSDAGKININNSKGTGLNYAHDYHSKQVEKFQTGSVLRRAECGLFSEARSRIPLGETRCEKKKAQSDFKAELLNTDDTAGIIDESSNNVQRSAITSDNARTMIDRTRYLARSPFTAASANEREAVSQWSDATSSRKSRQIVRSRGGFVLHSSRDDIPQIDADSSLHEPADSLLHALREAECAKRKPLGRNDHFERKLAYRYERALHNQSKSESLTWSLENDSLENCTALPEICAKPGDSDSTGLSSSSAENLMREWLSRLAPKENQTRDRQALEPAGSITPDASSNILGQIAARISSRQEADAPVSCSSRASVPTCQTRIDAPSLPRCTSKSHAPDLRLSSKNDTKLIPLIEEKDESEETRASPDTNLQDYKAFLRTQHPGKSPASAGDIPESKNPFDHGTSEKSIHNRIPGTYVSVHSNRQAIAMEMLSFYQKMFEDTREMDWESFQVFVEHVHPRQKELWRDICRAIGNEARRAADEEGVNTEVCIEITPAEYKSVKTETGTAGNEIVFEMDITFADIEIFLDKGLTSMNQVELDTYQRGNGRY